MKQQLIIWGFVLLFLLAGCRESNPAIPTLQPAATIPNITISTISPDPTAVFSTPSPAPTATPTEPLAALVNQQPITLARYEQELARYEQGVIDSGATINNEDYRILVLDSLIEMSLIVQGAQAAGLTVPAAEIDAQITLLENEAGTPDNFTAWLEANQWNAAQFRETMHDQLLMGKLLNQITASVPQSLPHVHARYIELNDPILAQTILDQINSGEDFKSLAVTHSLDRRTGPLGGDLGYFSQGTLLIPELEEAAFILAVGATSSIIQVTHEESGTTSYYLIQTIARDENRLLQAGMRADLASRAFTGWLNEQLAEAEIIRFLAEN